MIDADAGSIKRAPRSVPLPEPSPLRMLLLRTGDMLFQIVNLGIFFALWEWMQTSAWTPIKPEWIPPPSAIVGAIAKSLANGELVRHASYSINNYAIGLGVAIAIGIPVGLIIGSTPLLRGIGGAYVWALYTMPIIAVQPILIIILGFGAATQIFLITLMSTFPVIINTMDGMATLDQSLLRAGKVFGASRAKMFTRIVVPSIAPWILTGMRLAAVRGLLAMLIAELFGSLQGLGFMIIRASEVQDTPTAYAAIAVIVALSMGVVYLFNALEAWLTPWRQKLRL
ncbi:MAG TPA: ABC transporter permease [Chloroflexaceae bacterium]|nr:ABC transporter permease [Chloroflexaceae bacterium]